MRCRVKQISIPYVRATRPFGELLTSNSWNTDHFFSGDERDAETNFDHTQFRQYSSQLGRWMHPDPAGLAAVAPSNPQSWNRYSYVFDNPLTFIDPLGLCPKVGETPFGNYNYGGPSCNIDYPSVSNWPCFGFLGYWHAGCPQRPPMPPQPTIGPQPEKPLLHVCSAKALFLNSLDLKLKFGLEGKLKGIIEGGISYTLKSFSGQTGGEMSAKTLGIGAEYSNTSYSGNPMANPETSEFKFVAGPYSYNPVEHESATQFSKMFSSASLVIGIGGEISFDVTKYNQQAKAAGCDVIQ